jgi:carbon storage regulator CsrA
MLVLSRKPKETIVFPNLGIKLEIVRIAGGKVRVGIDAPLDVAVLRGELCKRIGAEPDSAKSESGAAEKSPEHHLRNRLHTARLGLKLLEKQLAAGMFDEAEETLNRALGIFQLLDSELGRTNKGVGQQLGRRALVVEDDANESHLLAGILRMSGYAVQTARDGLEALELLKKNRPDFVLMDMNMPRCDGPTALASIRSNPQWRGLRVFAVTGCTRDEIGEGVDDLGVERWFQKPVDPEVLLDAMSESKESQCVAVC